MVSTRFVPVLALAAVATAAVEAMPRVDPAVHRTLRQQGTVNLIVTMKAGTDSVLNSVQESEFATRGQRIASLVEELESHSKATQSPVDALLSKEAGTEQPLFAASETFWISNQKYIKEASPDLLAKLIAMPEIQEIREELVLPLPKVTATAANTTEIRPLANEWGVTKVGAPTVWATGNTGQGVVVGHIDSGVRYTHTALKSSFRNDGFSWYDPYTRKTTPTDEDGHGTHTLGSIVGSGGVGVAPGAKWISCRGCDPEGCTESALLSCAQFMTCPTNPAGSSKDCSKAPDLVSNSWGGGQGDTFYNSAVNAWRSAGIVPIFANGNEGPSCSTSSSPGDSANVIAVGATDSSDGLAYFSSKGPSVNGVLKPEVSAPGYNVRSASKAGDSSYELMSGTSMATPHVAGVVALLLSAKPSLSVTQVRSALIQGVDTTTLKSTGYRCGSTTDGKFPNNMYGYGRVNAVKVIAAKV
ncbi:hypothetical protein Poli38472_001720 [Pythium oligandrum]|uniref:subtilisin n=1 Tax=Pythium oligandrum TaxID=41045 RepID=A0A8K1CU34_PYTOL|nr:hypothetical protein Poli38472_001720 [Pythium oligandrum]|eukprot:TMW69564.1 hypothetical protein Poli38472_001720 [Pythium oligandrum]